jgi:hypothetical protein
MKPAHLSCVLIAVALVCFTSVRAGAGTTLTISAQANIFGAGHLPPMDTPNPSGGSGGVPPVVFAFPPNQFRALTFTNVTGSVKLGNPCAPNGPDGGNFGYRITSYNGIAGIEAPVLGYLTGVFLDSNEPTDPPPAALNFSIIGRNFKTFSPQIGQVFFIGDGLTDQGVVQQFIVPPTATRLFLGIADSRYSSHGPGYYHDNTGSFSATIKALPLTGLDNITASPNPPVASTPIKTTPVAPTYVTSPDSIALAKDNVFGYALPDGLRLSHDIEASTDLIHWTPATNVSLYFKDWDSTNFNQRFYRVGP